MAIERKMLMMNSIELFSGTGGLAKEFICPGSIIRLFMNGTKIPATT